ncbi:winged helix-turn-helix domain-containing protein [Steroidobacter sp.]|uniref:winged helix-turn-helix domain-containing protein n=1 Tax=Steroidobacter sp. TaxID=1978227 RepID=UPI001A49AA68|nr:winged helix-turn-helix domain-containing protein [Steroidobacter sp.]MBL8264906.1 winged helix-turn-helix domain-containing protein [Steroidobacter sp.]
MARRSTQQVALKPQDLYILLALLTNAEQQLTYAKLAKRTGMAASAVHASLKRAVLAGLAAIRDGNASVLKPQLREFVLGGAKYAFPAVLGRISRGVPTAYAAEPLKSVIAPSSDPVPVWSHKTGKTRGVSLAPLYPTVPEAASRDASLYAVLALFDAYRSGQARERAAAQKLLEKYFSAGA